MSQQKLALDKVHVLEKIPGSLQFRLTKTNPAMRLARKDDVVYLQGGKVFDQGGNLLAKEKQPGWLADEMKTCNPVALRECGFGMKE